MDENKEINKNAQNPNSNSKNNKCYKYKNRRKKLADSLQNENDTPKIDQNSNKENSENSENKTEKKKKKNPFQYFCLLCGTSCLCRILQGQPGVCKRASSDRRDFSGASG